MTQALLAPVQHFVDDLRALCAEGRDDDALWPAVEDRLKALLADPALRAHAAGWPDTSDGRNRPGNLLFYVDPDYGFALNALVKTPGADTAVHDHGESWTLYGVLEGGERILRFRRTDDGPRAAGPARLEPVGERTAKPGDVDLVPPWEIHQECNGPHRTIGFIVRSRQSGSFVQYRYDEGTGAVNAYSGPDQIPYALG